MFPPSRDQIHSYLVYSYPAHNCLAIYGLAGTPVVYQDVFANYLDHSAGKSITSLYLNSSAFAQSVG